MKKGLILFFVLLVCLPTVVFSTQFHSVEIGHEAYRMIDVAVIRGVIPPQNDVRPYNVNVVKKLLAAILSSDSFSESEKNHVERILNEFDPAEETSITSEFMDLFKKGYLRTNNQSAVSLGGKVAFDSTVGRTSKGDNVLDLRTNVMAYIKGDLFDFMSYDLNFKLNVDKVDVNASIVPDLRINCDGFYMKISDGGSGLMHLPDDKIYLGIEQFSEISFSFKDEMFSARIGTVKRDWGPGFNNLAISGSARAFDAIELDFKPSSWFSYSVLVGSLGNFAMIDVNGVEWPSEHWDQSGKYFNNLSSHRVELGPFSGFKFGVWESVVWRKRFEMAYLNPFTIYMFAQNGLGDYDNVLAGLDFSYTWKGVGQFYYAFSMDEMNNAHLLTSPRNIVAFQLGARFSPKFLDFSELTVQATYVTAFYGSHYSDKNPLFGDVEYNIAYVNKGQNIGYPVNPDTIELLVNFRTSFGKGWTADLTVKDQMRSAQYAIKDTGTDVLTTMDYDGFARKGYYDRDFFGNIWNNILCVDAKTEKKLESFPVSFSFGLHGIWDRTRPFEPISETYEKTIVDKETGETKTVTESYYPGKVDFKGDWTSTFTLSASFGAHLYY